MADTEKTKNIPSVNGFMKSEDKTIQNSNIRREKL